MGDDTGTPIVGRAFDSLSHRCDIREREMKTEFVIERLSIDLRTLR